MDTDLSPYERHPAEGLDRAGLIAHLVLHSYLPYEMSTHRVVMWSPLERLLIRPYRVASRMYMGVEHWERETPEFKAALEWSDINDVYLLGAVRTAMDEPS